MKKVEEFIVQADPADHGKVKKATLHDLMAMEFYGVPRWNYLFNFVGSTDDGTMQMAYAYINHHGTGKITLPIVFAMSTSMDPSNSLMVKFTGGVITSPLVEGRKGIPEKQ
jgi:hypothetical protein